MSELTERLRHPAWLRTNPPTLASIINVDTMTAAADRIDELEALIRRFKRERHDAQCIDHLLSGLTCSCQALEVRSTNFIHMDDPYGGGPR